MLDALLEAIDAYPSDEGLSLSGVIDLPEPLGAAINRLIRRGALSLPELSHLLGLPPEDGRLVADRLVMRGLIIATEHGGAVVYRARMARKQGREFTGRFRRVIEDL
ncbi:MAG TPA: hypothetical protein PKC19_21900 [Roseiflexaceae bacterium]|nr:hypothetical protein [Roseiflexaceae bacterium]